MRSFILFLKFSFYVLFSFSWISCSLFVSKEKKELEKKCLASVADENLINCIKLGFLEQDDGNFEKAKKWFKYSCDKDMPDSCFHLGQMEEKLGNPNEALKIYKKFCYKGNGSECLGLLNLEIKLIGKTNAIEKYKKECSEGKHVGCVIAKMIEKDGKNHWDFIIASTEISCEAGKFNDCQWAIEELNKRGETDKAKIFYEIGCKKGNKEYCKKLKN